MKDCIFTIITVSMVAALVVWACGRAMDRQFDNRDRMLCKSAVVSGNREYLKKCKCFFEGQSIRCIYEEDK